AARPRAPPGDRVRRAAGALARRRPARPGGARRGARRARARGLGGRRQMIARLAGLALLVLLAAARTTGEGTERPLDRLKHIIVIYQENWSFDGLFGKFPGADGLTNASATSVAQTDKAGRPYATLPPSIDTRPTPPVPDARIPASLPVAPFDLAAYVPPTSRTGNPIHRFYHQQHQINGGRMDRFVAWTNVGGLVMSHYDATDMPLGRLAREFVLADNFFHAAFG